MVAAVGECEYGTPVPSSYKMTEWYPVVTLEQLIAVLLCDHAVEAVEVTW